MCEFIRDICDHRWPYSFIFNIFMFKMLSTGEHPRMGSMDVCPFIPVQDATMEDCVEVAKEFAERLAIELGVPGKEHLCVACVIERCELRVPGKEHLCD